MQISSKLTKGLTPYVITLGVIVGIFLIYKMKDE